MPVIFASEKYFVYGHSTRLVVHSLKDSVVNEIEVPSSPVSASKPTESEANGSGEQDTEMDLSLGIFSYDSSYFALADNRKRVLVYRSKDSVLLKTFTVERKLVKMIFNNQLDKVIVADRSGDVYSYSLNQSTEKGELLCGHLSMLLDIALNSTEDYLITCDRDEKIRISNFPNCYNIHGYCLGHTEFVSSLCLLNNFLLSGSGDGSIRLWNYVTGKELHYVKCMENDAILPVRSICHLSANRIAVSFFKSESIYLYDITEEEIRYSSKLKATSELISVVPLEDNLLVCTKGMPFLTFHKINSNTSESCSAIESFISEALKQTELTSRLVKSHNESEVDTLFKQWYDNVGAYTERKKVREENILNIKKQKVVHVSENPST